MIRALGGGDASSALACLDEALALWRGPAYADCAGHPFVVAESQRLQELRTAAAVAGPVRGPGAAPTGSPAR